MGSVLKIGIVSCCIKFSHGYITVKPADKLVTILLVVLLIESVVRLMFVNVLEYADKLFLFIFFYLLDGLSIRLYVFSSVVTIKIDVIF